MPNDLTQKSQGPNPILLGVTVHKAVINIHRNEGESQVSLWSLKLSEHVSNLDMAWPGHRHIDKDIQAS